MHVSQKVKIRFKRYVDDMPDFTFNKIYTITRVLNFLDGTDNLIYVNNDIGINVGYYSWRFIDFHESRKNKLERIC